MERKNKIVRESNYELMRIISMLLIILYHCIVHGHSIQNTSSESLKIILEIIVAFTMVHVNSFVLVSGYFQSTSKFKQGKLWSIIGASLFYKIVIYIIFLLTGMISFKYLDILYTTSLIDPLEHWFIKTYILLYLMSPFLNKIINILEKDTYKKFIIIMFFVFSILPYLSAGEIINNNGFTVVSFIMLYFIGAYLRIYPPKESDNFKNKSNSSYQLFTILLFIICMSLNYLLYTYSNELIGTNNIFNKIGMNLKATFWYYSNPLVIFQSIAYFLFFGTLSFKNKFINKVASLTIGIYLIHDNTHIRDWVYKFLKVDVPNIESIKYVFYLIAITLLIFIVCAIIEWLRQILFKFIYKWKISEIIRNKYYSYIDSFNADVKQE